MSAGAAGQAAAAPCAERHDGLDEPRRRRLERGRQLGNGGPSADCDVQIPSLTEPYVVTLSGGNEDVNSLTIATGRR